MEEIYTSIFKDDYNADLVIERDWEDGTVNAYAQQNGNKWIVKMFGGLARHPETTLDGFRAVICHEIGHHIAGAPKKKSWYGTTWASNEGQSDYYATTKCLRKLYLKEKHLAETLQIYSDIKNTDEEKLAKKECDSVYKDINDKAVCYRSSLAGKSLARLLGSLRGNSNVKYSTPDTNVVSTTNHNHPAAQCRLDTYFQGALCINDHDKLADENDVRLGYCTVSEGYKIGNRPQCWYNIEQYEK
jgi:hypothetical protein